MEKKTIIPMVILVLIVGLVLVWFIVNNNIVKQANQIIISNVELSGVEDGIYTGEYIQSPVKAVVQVEIKNHEINKIKVLEHQNGLGQKAEIIVDDILEKQKLDIDLVTGATVSSKVILKAVEDALSK